MSEPREPRIIDVATLADCLGGIVPIVRGVPEVGHTALNKLAEIFDLPMDCYGLDISIRIDEPVKVSVHRYPTVKE